MKSFRIETTVAMPATEVWNRFNRNMLEYLKPAWLSMAIDRFDGCKTGDEYILKIGPFRQTWHGIVSLHGETDSGYFFVDEGIQLPFPLQTWKHEHQVNQRDTCTLIVDEISFSTGNGLSDLAMTPVLFLMFRSRRKKYRKLLGRP